jgi:uroporphyrinogen decarboxylase
LKADGFWVEGSGGRHPFKQAWHMRGFENFLCDYLANPDWVEGIYSRLTDYNVHVCRALAEAGVDMIDYWGDVAMQDRMIVPPDRWRSLDKPVWRRIIAETRKVNPDVRFFFHSDGDVTPIIDDVIEVGFDVLNPLQPECVNPARVKAVWGDRITLDGGGSVQRTLPRGTLEDVRAEVDFLMTHCAYNGGYVFRASNVVQFGGPLENIVAFYEMARDYDLSKLAGPPEDIPEPPCLKVQ